MKENIEHVLSSTYVRAIQTVEGLANFLRKDIILEPDFRERALAARDHFFDDHAGAVKRVFDDPHFAYPGGESNLDAQERGIKALREVVRSYQGQRVAIGIHGNIMVCIMNCFSRQ